MILKLKKINNEIIENDLKLQKQEKKNNDLNEKIKNLKLNVDTVKEIQQKVIYILFQWRRNGSILYKWLEEMYTNAEKRCHDLKNLLDKEQ